MTLQVIPVPLGPVSEGDDLASMISSSARLEDGDVLVVSHKAVSKQEGRVVELAGVRPSPLASGLASAYGKDPRVVELVLCEAHRIVRMGRGVIITETRHGLVCANSGVDESNAGEGRAVLLPLDPDASAQRLRSRLREACGADVAVLVSDTMGRPFRLGQTDCAVGSAGMDPLLDLRGSADAHGRMLRSSVAAVADEACSAAELVRPKSAGVPAAVLRGLRARGGAPASSVLRPPGQDLFR